jgi:PEP-CTERM motif
MKLNLAILFCVIALIAAVPVWADGIPHSTIVADSSGGSSGTKLNAPGLLVESGSIGAKPSIAPDTFFPSSSDMDVHHGGLSSFDSHDRTSFVSRTGGAWWVAEEHRNHKRDWNKEEPTLDPVPEPGSLSLLLSGLLSLGFLAHRRAAGTI